ncbi:unnamed protein product [Zymoseptoria tritici ST99CH_1E4]|uniref:Amine oxidase domain-containing protein n=1 Tax=Zymoseptoria tritici ST99CH_1E4 TaxID=1276532 RepID=A0A2H1FJ30_ZYMTR|nr:unnamed protein product [Zymoseptoria tritici ST99CH_1E4]
MKSTFWSALSLSVLVASETIIERDVAIVGGGAAGTFAAHRLQQMGLSVALIEKSYRVGGHVSTWVQPSTGIVLDYGVQIFTNLSVVHDYFSHFNISLVTQQGQGDILSLPALYVLRQLPLTAIQGLSSGFLTAPIGVQTLYDRALLELGEDSTFLNATITHIDRSNPSDISICLTTLSSSSPIRIRAKTLLLTLPPTLPNLSPFLDLTPLETSLFSYFTSSAYYNALLTNTGLPPNKTYRNLNPLLPYSLPSLPAIYETGSTAAPGITGLLYGAPSSHPLTDEEVKADILATLARLRRAAGGDEGYVGEPEFVGFNNHAPNALAVSADVIRDGFYTELKGLQGRLNTFWSGATWASDNSGAIWEFTEDVILPRVVKAVRGGGK